MSLVADVFDVILIDPVDASVIATTTLTDASIDVKVDAKNVTGGKGNNILGILHSGRNVTIKLTDAEFRYDWLAKNLGSDIVTGTGVAYAMSKNYTLDATKKITLDHEPITTDSGLAIFDKNGKLVESSAYTVAASDVTFTTGAAGDTYEVRTYKYNTDETAEIIDISAVEFAKGMTCILETLELDGSENKLYTLQYQFFNAVPDGNFTIDTKSDKTAYAPVTNLTVIKPLDKDSIGQIIRIPVAV